MTTDFEAEKMSLGQLFLRLKATQVWAFVGTLAAIVATAFGIGYQFSSITSQGELNVARALLEAKQTEITRLDGAIAELKLKSRFLSLYLRFEQAEPSGRDVARAALDKFVETEIDAAAKSSAAIQVWKGQGKQATVTFSDGTAWELPKVLTFSGGLGID